MSDPNKIFKTSESIWQEFGIFPEVLSRRADVANVRAGVEDQFRKLGTGNLRLLCEEFQITYEKDADRESIANRLISRFPQDLLVHAFEFQKRRVKSIQALFEARYPKSRSVSRRITSLSSNPQEVIDNKTRLLLLLNKSESHLRDIFYLSSWLSKDTNYRFNARDISETVLCKRLSDNIDALTEMLVSCSDLGGERLGCHDLNGQAFVIVHLRKYRPRVSRDYETTHNLHHICGTLILGVSHVDGFLHVKSSSKNVADTVQSFLVDKLGLEVERMEEQVVSTFQHLPLSETIAGKMPDQSPFILRGISLSRTSIGGVPLSIPRAPFNDNILATLEALHDATIVSAATPVHLDLLDFDYRGEIIKVSCKPLAGGAIRLSYNNSGLPDTFQEHLESDFEETFGVPLNRMLNPSQWSFGTSGIIGYVLRAKTREEIQEYQREIYETLLSLSIVEERIQKLKLCTNFSCKATAVPASDDAAECRACGASLRTQSITAIDVKQKGIQQWLKEFAKNHSGWDLGARTLTFESHKYFPVSSHEDLTQRIAAVFQHRINREKQEAFDRSSMPLVKFTDHHDLVPLRVERDDSAMISLPYLLTTVFDSSESPRIGQELKSLFTRVCSTYDSRVSRAARLSADRLEATPDNQDGDRYEVDVFNLMRWLFWYAARLGKKGKREPDGFLSLQDYRGSTSPTDLGLWNLGYDAKFSRKAEGYDFGPGEQRQAAEYIKKYFRAKKNNVRRDRRILGHAIVTNGIRYEKMGAFVQQLRDAGVVSATEASPVIALVRDEFLLRLYRKCAEDEMSFRKKRLHMHFYLVDILNRSTPHGFVELSSRTADYILKQMEASDPIEDLLSVEELQRNSFAAPPDDVFIPLWSSPDFLDATMPSE